jgi:hypothetical protein
MVTQETIGYTMKTKYRKTLQLYIKIPIIKYIVYVLYKIKSSQNTLDRNTPHCNLLLQFFEGILFRCLTSSSKEAKMSTFTVSVFVLVFFWVQWFEARGSCLFCGYWTNCWHYCLVFPFMKLFRIYLKYFFSQEFHINWKLCSAFPRTIIVSRVVWVFLPNKTMGHKGHVK